MGLVSAVVGLSGLCGIQTLQRTTERLLTRDAKVSNAAEKMVAALERQDSAALLYLLGKQELGTRLFLKSQQEFLGWYAKAKESAMLASETGLLDLLGMKSQAYSEGFFKLGGLALEGSTTPRTEFYLSKMYPAFMAARQAGNDLQASIQRQTERTRITLRARSRNLALFVVLVFFVGNAASLGLMMAWGRRVFSSLQRLERSLKDLADGGHTGKIPVKSADEVGQLACAFNGLIEALESREHKNTERLLLGQKRLEQVLEGIRDGILVADASGTITLANKAAADIWGLTAHAIQGKHLLELKAEEPYALLKEALGNEQSPSAANEPPLERTMRLTCHTGTSRHFLLRISRLQQEPNEPGKAVLIFSDITKLKELDQLKTEFFQSASHELRTPLTSILMGAGLLAESELIPEGSTEKRLVVAVREDALRLRRIVADLIDLSRIEVGKIPMRFASENAASLLQQTERLFAAQAKERGVSLVLEPPPSPLWVWADPKILWVFSNLIGNALRYTQEGGTIRIGLKDQGAFVAFWVLDTGVGIPKEQQEAIFHRFSQIEGPGPSGALGIGLAIARDVVEAHGGRIWVESVSGSGSTFFFTVPKSAPLERR
ncbi:MAG: ATP-binding protein [Nitrospirota bacterium]|nr:ATP-binding protein [Nitrospirota bacterium]